MRTPRSHSQVRGSHLHLGINGESSPAHQQHVHEFTYRYEAEEDVADTLLRTDERQRHSEWPPVTWRSSGGSGSSRPVFRRTNRPSNSENNSISGPLSGSVISPQYQTSTSGDFKAGLLRSLLSSEPEEQLPRRVIQTFRDFRKHRATLSFRISSLRDERQRVRLRQRTVLEQRLRSTLTGRIVQTDAEDFELEAIINYALESLDDAERYLNFSEDDLMEANGRLVSSEGQLKNLINPDDASDCLEILDEVFEAMSLNKDGDSRFSADAEVDLSELQQDLLDEALCNAISDPNGLVDIDALLAHRTYSSASASVYGEADAAEYEQEMIEEFQKAFERELIVRLSGVQFESPAFTPPDILPADHNILEASLLQITKRQRDLEYPDPAAGYDDFGKICRTSWLEFSKLLWHLEPQYDEQTRFITNFSVLEIDDMLGERQNTEELQEAPAAAFEWPSPRLRIPRHSIPTTPFNAYARASLQTQSARTKPRHRSLLSFQGNKDLPFSRPEHQFDAAQRPRAKSLPAFSVYGSAEDQKVSKSVRSIGHPVLSPETASSFFRIPSTARAENSYFASLNSQASGAVLAQPDFEALSDLHLIRPVISHLQRSRNHNSRASSDPERNRGRTLLSSSIPSLPVL